MTRKKFNKVILWGKRHREKSIASTLIKLKKHLEKNNITVLVDTETAALFKLDHCHLVCEKDFQSQADLIIVVGGDGSLLTAARSAVIQKMPVLGINRGKLGFLTDISPNVFTEVDQVLAGQYTAEKRSLINARIIRRKKTVYQNIALNDVVLLPSDVGHMIEFAIEINREFMCIQRADGLIVATPTGSTAYALSGGGPILHPKLDAFVLVPMFPHKLTSRPIVIAGNSKITIKVSHHNETLPRLSCDGQIWLPLEYGDEIKITQYEQPLTLIHSLHYQYFSTLRSKLQWENRLY